MNMRKTAFLFTITILGAGVDGLSLAVAEAEQRIAVVDIQAVITKSERGASAKSKVESAAKKEEVKVKQLAEELKRTRADLDKQSSLLSGKALEDKQTALKKKERDIARSIQDRREELVRLNRDEVGNVVKMIDKEVETFGKQGGYTAILEADPAMVLYFHPSLEVSDKIVEILNAKRGGE